MIKACGVRQQCPKVVTSSSRLAPPHDTRQKAHSPSRVVTPVQSTNTIFIGLLHRIRTCPTSRDQHARRRSDDCTKPRCLVKYGSPKNPPPMVVPAIREAAPKTEPPFFAVPESFCWQSNAGGIGSIVRCFCLKPRGPKPRLTAFGIGRLQHFRRDLHSIECR